MKSLIPVLVAVIVLASCGKSKNESDFIWEKSYGDGEALFIRSSSDSGFAACGESGSKPFLVRLNKKRVLVAEYKGDFSGLFNSMWFDTSGYVAAGNLEGKMLLVRLSPEGNKLWEKTFITDYKIDYTNLYYNGNGTFLAIGTASPDSSGSGATGLVFVRFDTTGYIISENNIPDPNFISARGAAVDDNGNLYLALTRRNSGYKPKASIAKLNDLYQKLWETDLYNNPDFGAACTALAIDGSGNIYVSGKTELPKEEGVLNNSFLVSLSASGSVRWKRYLENNNEGSSVIFDGTGNLLMLNRNCYIVNQLDPSDGADVSLIRMFSVCLSNDTNAEGSDFDFTYDNNIIVAGKRGERFYLAIKSYP